MTADKTYAEVRKRLSAAPEKVFATFAEAHLVRQWLSPSPEIKLTLLHFDFRVGGAYRFAYHLPGGETVIIGGAYRSIEPPSKIVFSWIIEPPDEHAGIVSEVTVTITPDGNGTELVIRHEKLGRIDAIERHAGGWRGAVDQLAALLEARGSVSADYDLPSGVRAALAGIGNVHEVRMFGGIGFMLNGNMVAAVSKRGLLVRVGKELQQEALTRPDAGPMKMRGRTIEGYIYVDPAALSDDAVRAWLKLACAFVETLPPKIPRVKPVKMKGKRT